MNDKNDFVKVMLESLKEEVVAHCQVAPGGFEPTKGVNQQMQSK